jgi:alpha-2-macroglobulin
MIMVWRKVAHIALGCALLIGFQLYGIAGLVQNEPPRGSVFGVAYSERTLAPIPRTLVRLTLISPPETPTQPEERPAPAPREPQEMRYRHQGWDRAYWYDWYECGYEFRLYSEGRTWEAITDEHGRFQLRGIPVGVYSVETSSKWSHAHQSEVVVREGERLDLSLAIQPPAPFLDLIHPQSVYHPDEPLRVGVRGFSEDDTIQLTLARVRQKTKDALPSELHALLDEIRYGWWRDDAVLEEQLKRYNAYYETEWSGDTPVRGRDPEGVFTQYVDLPKQRDGTYLLQAQVGQKRRAALIVVSSIGVVSKVSRESTELWCTDLRTGQPVEQVLVRVYRSQKARAEGAPARKEMRLVAEARTNRDGLARFGKIEPHEDWRYRDTLIAVHSPRTGDLVYWGHVRVAPWTWDLNGAPDGEPLSGVLYTDRPIYRPGHTVHFKGIARLGAMQGYRLPPPNTPVRIAVLNPRDEVVYETRTTTNAMGAFHASFPTSPEAETGYYTIRADVGNYGTIQHSVPLSAYRKPTYRITLKPERKLYMPNETVRIPIQTEYYFGMPVPNTQLTYTIYRREQWRWYDHGEYDPAPLEADAVDEEEYDYYDDYNDYGQVIQVGELTTDASGRATLTLSARDLLPTDERERRLFWDASSVSYEYTVEVHALSEGWEGAKASALFEVAPSVWEATLTPDLEFGEPGVAYRYRVRLTDRRTGAPVQATLTWQATLKIRAGERTRVGLQYEGTVRTNEFGVGEFQFTPERGGDWEVSLAARDPEGYRFTTRHTLWLWNEAYIGWWGPYRPADTHALEVRLQKRAYEPGEQVEVAIRTPHRDAAFYITVEGDRLYHSQVVRAQGALTRVRLPVTREQIPNAYVSVCMVRDKELIRREVEYRVGKRQGVMQVQVQTDKPRYEPGEAMLVRLQTADQQGKPVPAEVSLAVVDEAIYAIREDRPAAVRSAFYHRRWNAVQTDFSAYWLALQGDKGAVETIRRDFPDTAYWQPMIRTDARGQATVRLRLPDNITEWRLTAIAHTADTKIGYARAKVKAAKDLVARLRLPMWLVEGDRTEINAILSNDTDQPREVVVELRAPDGVRTQTVRLPARNSTTLRWDYTPQSLGEQKFVLIAREKGGRLRDAEERTLLVKPLSLTETDSRAILLSAERTLTLTLRPDALTERTTLTLRSYPSASAIALDSLPYLLDYPYGCVEQTVSRFVPAMLAKRAAEQLGVPMDTDTQRKIAEIADLGLQRLSRLQLEDGGWGWWEAEEPNAWLTAYAVWGLHKAKQAGVPVPEPMYRKGVDALRRQVVESIEKIAARDSQAGMPIWWDELFPLMTLALVDPTPPDRLRYDSKLLSKWMAWLTDTGASDGSDRWRQVYRLQWVMILHHWRGLPNAEAHLRALWRALQREASEDRNHIDWEPPHADEWFWYSWHRMETQAIALLALVEARPLATELFGSPQRYEQLVGKTVTGLALGCRNGRWYSSRDTALAVEALLEYSLRYERGYRRESEYEVWLNGQRVRTVAVGAPGGQHATLALRLTGLPWRAGENTLVLRPVRGAPLVSMTFEQPRKLAFQDADAPVGPLQLRVYRVERPAEMTTPGERLRPLRSGDTIRTGELLRIDVVARMPQKASRLDYTVLETPFPAGCAPFDTEAFLTAWWWDYDHEEIRDDRAVAFRSEWHRGNDYRYTLLVRAESPGEYTILPAHLWGMYAPYQAHSNPFRIRIAAR